MPLFIVFGLTQPKIKPESIVLVVAALSFRPLMVGKMILLLPEIHRHSQIQNVLFIEGALILY